MKIRFFTLAIVAFFAISTSAFACGNEEGAGWRFDSKVKPWTHQAESPADGYWVFKNPFRCMAQERWTFVYWDESGFDSQAQARDFWANADKHFCFVRNEQGKPVSLHKRSDKVVYFPYRLAQLAALEKLDGKMLIKHMPTCNADEAN